MNSLVGHKLRLHSRRSDALALKMIVDLAKLAAGDQLARHGSVSRLYYVRTELVWRFNGGANRLCVGHSSIYQSPGGNAAAFYRALLLA
jgi:hypothetical protein